eukprot:gene27675-42363_t
MSAARERRREAALRLSDAELRAAAARHDAAHLRNGARTTHATLRLGGAVERASWRADEPRRRVGELRRAAAGREAALEHALRQRQSYRKVCPRVQVPRLRAEVADLERQAARIRDGRRRAGAGRGVAERVRVCDSHNRQGAGQRRGALV